MKPVTKKIPLPLYKKIRAVMPVLCVDVIITHGKSFLLAKRTNEPEKGKWFFPGGRVYKNERFIAGARRKLKEEVGATSSMLKFLGVYEYFSNVGYFGGDSSHNIVAVFHAPVKYKGDIKLDSQNSEFKWFTATQKNFHPYLKEYLHKLGFRY